ncbi:MAG: ribbon-helix-helix protein, CopG family [Gammaproteobacteria bacterium]|nr:ribbon-helix-helix protein, CopG family [Gammaproteobacteria bacterium]
MSVTTVRLQPDIEQSLQAMAEALQRSKNWVINQAVKEFAEKQALEQQRWQETLQAMTSVAQGQVVAGDDVHAWLQSWGTTEELPVPKIDA